jgi:hypothetical protein
MDIIGPRQQRSSFMTSLSRLRVPPPPLPCRATLDKIGRKPSMSIFETCCYNCRHAAANAIMKIAVERASDASVTAADESTHASSKAVAMLEQNRVHHFVMVLLFFCTSVILLYYGLSIVVNFHLSGSHMIDQGRFFEVLTLPGSNTDCNARPEYDSLQFCVMTYGCSDSPATPKGRCGLSVFWNGLSALCVNPSNKKRIVGASGVYSRNIATYELTCVGNGTSCLEQALPKSANSCDMFWPTLRSVVSKNIPNSKSITDPTESFQIRGAVPEDSGIWFNMCGFCSFATEVK